MQLEAGCLGITNKEKPMFEDTAFHIFDKSTSTLTLFSGEIKQIDVNHLDKTDYLSAVKQKAISSGLIGESDFVCEWDV